MNTIPSFVPNQAARIVEMLRDRDNILVAAHAYPDGDAVGSTAAMGWILRHLGKRFALCNSTGFPEHFFWVPLPEPICVNLNALPFQPELLISLDCGDAHRLGKTLEELPERLPGINIDHHLGTPPFGSLYNWVEPGMAATGQMVAALAHAAGAPLTGPLAETIYLTLVTDTGGFAFGNTTAAVFRLAAELAENGLDVAAVRDKLDNQWSMARMCLWGHLLGTFTLHYDNAVALVTVSRSELQDCGADKEDLEGVVEQLRRLRGVRIAALLREDDDARCKLSLRSSGPTNVCAVAALFAGGGHRNAAGATLSMTLPQARAAVLRALDKVAS